MDPLLGLQVVFNLQRFYEYRLIVTTISSIVENFKMGLVTLVIVFFLKEFFKFSMLLPKFMYYLLHLNAFDYGECEIVNC
jgi:hypothetical protein